MKKTICSFIMFILLITAITASAVPEVSEQLDLIAANADLWKQEVDFGLWGFTVTDLDHNGLLEIISASVQGTGFYTYINAYEVNETGDGFTELQGPSVYRTDSAPDIMVSTVPVYYDKDANRYYYIFDDYIRNGMAEYYQNKRAVSIADGKWEENTLASKATVYSDADHFIMTCTESAGDTITEEQYDDIAQTVYAGLEQGEAEFDWQMTETNEFSSLTTQGIREKLSYKEGIRF